MADSGTDRFSFDKVFAALLGRGGGISIEAFFIKEVRIFCFCFLKEW